MATDILTSSVLLTQSLSVVVPAIKESIITSLGLRGRKAEETEDTSKFAEIVRESFELSNAKPDVLLLTWIVRTRNNLELQQKASLQQAGTTFIVTLIFLVLAILLVFTGVILIFTIGLQVGVVTSVSSIVSGIVSSLAFTFNKQANDRLNEYAKEMNALDKSNIAMQYISQITDSEKRDEAIVELAEKIYSGN